MDPIPYKISSLVYLRNDAGQLLLMQRNKAPNKGLWSPIGGKLEMVTGESPHEAAVREVGEEVGLVGGVGGVGGGVIKWVGGRSKGVGGSGDNSECLWFPRGIGRKFQVICL